MSFHPFRAAGRARPRRPGFLSGGIGAVQAVIGGTLRYQGPIAFVMRNRTSFDALAEVAAQMKEPAG